MEIDQINSKEKISNLQLPNFFKEQDCQIMKISNQYDQKKYMENILSNCKVFGLEILED